MSRKIIYRIQNIVLSQKDKFIKLARDIWAHPELGLEEKFACAIQVELLQKLGFEVETPYGGLDTAYKAVSGNKGPAFCFVAEYDALPGIGHGCGHNLICSAAIAAGWALLSVIKNIGIDGTVVVMGTPAEESKGGKIIMLENNILDGIDTVIMAHPFWQTLESTDSNAIRRFDISFKGKASHAAAAPELGLNALDAVISVFNGVNAWRQHLPEKARIHGIIIDGGKAPNIIPDYAKCRFFLRAPEEPLLNIMEKRFKNITAGAALITGTSYEIENFGRSYKSNKSNKTLNKLFVTVASELGMKPTTSQYTSRGSSDFGDFSHVKPGIHPYFGIAEKELALHSYEFAKAANSDYAMEQMLKAATAMAVIGYEYISDKSFREEIVQENNETKLLN